MAFWKIRGDLELTKNTENSSAVPSVAAAVHNTATTSGSGARTTGVMPKITQAVRADSTSPISEMTVTTLTLPISTVSSRPGAAASDSNETHQLAQLVAGFGHSDLEHTFILPTLYRPYDPRTGAGPAHGSLGTPLRHSATVRPTGRSRSFDYRLSLAV